MGGGVVSVFIAAAGVGVPPHARAAAALDAVMRPGGHGELGCDLVAHGLLVLLGPCGLWARRDGFWRVSRDWLGGGCFGGAGDPELTGGRAAVERLVKLALGNATAS